MIQKEYISKNHSKFLIKYHMIPVCKYRKKLLIGSVEYDMKQIMQKISNFSDFDIEVMETDKDHILDRWLLCVISPKCQSGNYKDT